MATLVEQARLRARAQRPPDYFSVQMHLLHACNLTCAHCYDIDQQTLPMPDTAEVKRRLDAIYELGASIGFRPDIHLSGGEPTLRKDLVDLVRYIHQDKGGDTLLFTNGTRWSRELATDLWEAGCRYVQISLEGPQPLSDAIRGDGVHAKATETLRMLVEMGFELTVSVTITARNYPSLWQFIADLDPLEIHFHLREVFALGAGTELQTITVEQRREFAERAIAWQGQSSIGIEDPIYCSVDYDHALTQGGCVAGRNHFAVDVNGDVYPCRPLALKVGHMDDLAAAWAAPEMERLRNRELGGQCGRCELRLHCGGCRVHALAAGDLHGEDRRCFAEEQGLLRTKGQQWLVDRAEDAGRVIGRLRTK